MRSDDDAIVKRRAQGVTGGELKLDGNAAPDAHARLLSIAKLTNGAERDRTEI
jgi:hypothetical protein